MKKRRRNIENPTWPEQIEALTAELQNLPFGNERDALLRKIGQLKAATEMSDWLTPPPPKSP